MYGTSLVSAVVSMEIGQMSNLSLVTAQMQPTILFDLVAFCNFVKQKSTDHLLTQLHLSFTGKNKFQKGMKCCVALDIQETLLTACWLKH